MSSLKCVAIKKYNHPELKEVTLTSAMHALSDPCRMQIMRALIGQKELSCKEMPVDVAKATLSHHINVLRDAGLIYTRVEGTKCLNSVRENEIEEQFPGLLTLVKNHS